MLTTKEMLDEKEKKKKEIKEQAAILKQYGTLNIDQDFLDKYVANANDYFRSAHDDYKGINYVSASRLYNQRNAQWNDLDATGRYIRNWLESNKVGIGADSYNSFNKVIDEITKGGASVLDAYRGAYEGYSEYASEDEFNAAMEQVKLTKEMETADLGALLREIEEMKAEEKRRKKLFNNQPTATSYKYSAIDDIDKAIAEKEVYYNKAKRLQTGIELASVANNEDFDLYDDYKSTVDNRGFWEQVLGEGDTTDLKYEYINNQYEAKGADDWIKYKQMTDDEIRVYNYLYAKEGRNKANEFLDSIEETLNSREAEQIYENVKGKTGLEVLFGVASGLEQFTSGIENALNFSDDYISQSTVQQAGAMMRNDLVDKGFKVFGTSLGQMAYDALNTGANMLPSVLVNVAVPGAGTVLMGASAAGNAKADALRKGMSKGQANKYGAMVGASEALLEKFLGGIPGISEGGIFTKLGQKILSKIDNAFARVAITLGTDALDEGLEESLQTVLEPWFESVVTKADYNAPNIDEILYAGLLGAISSLGFGGASVTLKTAIANADAKSQYSNLDDLGALMQEGKELGGKSLDIYNKMADKYSKGKDITGGQIRQLIDSNERIIGKSDKAKIQGAVKQRLNQLGETENVDKITDIITKKMMGEKLSFVDEFTIRKSKFGQRVLNEVENVGNENYTSKWATEIGTEGYGREKYSTNYDTTLDSNNNEVKINEVSVKKGTVKTESGQTVKIESLQLGTRDKALLDTAKKYKFNDEVATQFFNGYADAKKKGLSVEEYARGFAEAYLVGEYGLPEKELSSGGGIASALNESTRQLAYKLGGINAKYEISKKQAEIDQAKADSARSGKKFKSNGRVSYEGVNLNSLNERQKASLATIDRIAKIFGVDVVIYESPTDSEGNRVGANGWFNPQTNSIHLDLYAGRDGNSLMLYTMSHELTHFIRKWSPAKFKVLSDILMEYYGEQDISVQELVEAQIQKAANNGRDIDYDTAFEEVIADSCEKMLTDEKTLREISARVKQADVGLWNKIKSFFANIIAKIKSVYKDTSPDSPEGQYVTKLLEMGDKLQKAWVEGLVDASESYRALADNGIMVNTKTKSGSILSVRDVLSDKDRNKVANMLAKRFDVTTQEATNWLNAETSLASIILNPKYSQYLDYVADADEEAIKSNSDYPQGTVDFSNICKKRRDFTEIMNRIFRQFPNHVFDPTDLAKIRTIMEQEGMEVACAICYVEDRRQLDSVVGQVFIDSLNVYRNGGNIRPDNGEPFNARQLKAFELVEGDKYTPTIYELITLEGRNELKAKNPNMEKAWQIFNNARGMQTVRLLLNDAEYKRQILKYNKNTVQSKNNNGGLRIYSFSDMEMFHLIDIIQVITDSAAVGLAIQGYTKVNEYAKAVKDTGEKLNRSLIPKGSLGYHMENGKVVLDFDTVEGIDINHPDFFDSTDNPNIGNIVIGINPTQIRAAMMSKFIDYIIPFHTGQSKEVLGEKGIAEWVNYKDSQTEKDISTGKTSAHQINIYTEVFQAAENEGKPITNKVEFVNKFLEVCKKNNLVPRYAEFLNTDENGNYVYTEGYHKLIVDFKTFDSNTGEYLPQKPVKPIFDSDYLTSLLKDYANTQKIKDVEFAEKSPKVIERIKNEVIKSNDTKLSDRDSLGNELSKEQQEFFKDSKVRDADGNLIVAYHVTPNDMFYEFDATRHKSTTGTSVWGKGFYFSDEKASYYWSGEVGAKNALECYLNIKKPFMAGNGESVPNDLKDYIMSTDTYKESSQYRKDYLGQKASRWYDFLRFNVTNDNPNAVLQSLGYDGIIVGDNFEIVIFDSNQAKLTTNKTPTSDPDIRYSVRDIVGASGKNYGKGVYLDSTLLTNLTDEERVEMVKEYLKEIGGRVFTAYDNKGNAVNVHIVKSGTKFKNSKGKKVFVNQHLTNYVLDPIKQEAIALIDELILTARQGENESAVHPHGWLDDNGKNNWDVWRTYIQDKEKTVWEAKLRIANSVNGEKILYEVYPIKKVEGIEKIDTTSTKPIVPQKNDSVKRKLSDRYDEGLSEADKAIADSVIGRLKTDAMASKYGIDKYASYTAERMNHEIRSSIAEYVPDYATSYIAWVKPLDFISATTVSEKSIERIKGESTKLDIERLRKQTQPIYLAVDFETGKIVGHEGRHRMTALNEAGVEKVAVIIDARHHDIEHTKPIDMMYLGGQRFGDYGTGTGFYLHNALPISQRYASVVKDLFSFKNKSGVSFSDRDNASVSNRSLLANALESVAQNDIEKKKLNEYKAEVDLLDADEVKLREIKAQIKELSFAEGQRDTAKIKSLKEEATKLENRINIRDKKLLGLESTTALKNVLEREKSKAIKRERENAKLREQGIKVKAREHEANMIAATKSLAKQKLLDSHEARSKREERAKLQKTVLDTIKWLQSPSKTDVKCPDVLKEPLLELLEKIDLTSQRQLKGGASTINDEMIARRLQTLANTVKQISNSQNPTMNGNQGNQNSLLDAGYLDLPQDFVDDLNDLADAITQRGTNYGYDAVNRLTSTEIKALRKMLTQLTKSIKDIAKLGANSRFSNVIQLGNESIDYLKSLGNIAKTNIAVDALRWGNALPYYAFKKFGSAGESIFEELMDAQDKLAFLSQDILNFKEKTWTNKEVQAWSKDKVEIQLDSGETINPTIAQVMGIYCLSQRVTANGDYIGLNHMLGGGITLVGEETKTGKIADKGTLLTGDDVIRICNMLDARQKQVAEKIQEFMSTVCSDWGNEISMMRFMTKEFTETKYYPLESDDTNLKTKDPGQDQSDLFRLLNISATKALTKNANNRIFIRDIFDVFANHASDMARLNAYGMAILDYMKWLNYQNKSYSSTSTQVSVESVKGAMKDAFGSKAQGYLVNLIKDINGRSGDAIKFAFLSKAMKRAKIASVGANIRVAALQFTSYARANMVLSNKSLALGLTKKPQIKKAQKYCGIALWKSFGFFDTNIAKTIEEQIKGSKNFMDKLVELSMKGAEYADAITWGFLWNSCEYEVAKTTQLQVGTEEFYKEVGLKLREVVYSTQVVDSVLTRSQLMRSKDGLTQSLTAFMSEPTLSTNILADATWKFNEAKRTSGSTKQAWKTTRKIIGKTIANYCVMQLSVSLLESLFDAWRDDEDEKFIKKYGEAFLQNIMSNINPLSNIPVLTKVVDAILYLCGVGYRVSGNDLGMQWLDNIVNAATTWKEVIAEETGGKDTSKTVFKAINDTIKALSSLVGLPLGNAMREVVALWNNTAGTVDPTLKLHSYENTNEELGNLLYEAIIKGNDTSNIEAEFDNPKSIKSALKKALKDNDSRITEAAQYYYNGDLDEYSEIFDEILDEGNFESDIIKGAINSVVNDIEKQNKTETEDEVDEEKVYSKYTNNDVNIAFDNGDNALAKEIINELIDVKMQNGMDEKSARASVKSTITSHYKELFIEAYKTKNKTEQARIRKILYKSGLYGSTDDVIKTTNAWLTKK